MTGCSPGLRNSEGDSHLQEPLAPSTFNFENKQPGTATNKVAARSERSFLGGHERSARETASILHFEINLLLQIRMILVSLAAILVTAELTRDCMTMLAQKGQQCRKARG